MFCNNVFNEVFDNFIWKDRDLIYECNSDTKKFNQKFGSSLVTAGMIGDYFLRKSVLHDM